LWHKIEWSVDVESEFLVQSLSLHLCLLVKIENSPSLVLCAIAVLNSNSWSFFILWTWYFKC
jgi:hypothetical protein